MKLAPHFQKSGVLLTIKFVLAIAISELAPHILENYEVLAIPMVFLTVFDSSRIVPTVLIGFSNSFSL